MSGLKRLLACRDTLYGACALWIIFFHLRRRISMPWIPALTNAFALGNMGVDVFLFLSGLCLSLSAEKRDYGKNGWRGYWSRRFARVLLPYALVSIPLYLWQALFTRRGRLLRRAARFLWNASSASFWLSGTQTTWYVYAILVFYLLFPLIYRAAKLRSAAGRIAPLAAAFAVAALSARVPLLRHSLVCWARLPIFTLGVIAGTMTGRLDSPPRRAGLWLSAAALPALGWPISASEVFGAFSLPQILRLMLYIPMTFAALYLVSAFGRPVRVLEVIGRRSLEIYLIHIALLHVFKHAGITGAVGYWLYLILPAATLSIALIIGSIEDALLRRAKEPGHESLQHL